MANVNPDIARYNWQIVCYDSDGRVAFSKTVCNKTLDEVELLLVDLRQRFDGITFEQMDKRTIRIK